MAGTLNENHLKNIPRCHHGSMCVLKTGTSKNANHGKSFFICNNVEGRCSFATLAKDFQPTVCPTHEKMVELKAFAKKENGIRCYFRCTFGKEKGETWCGNEIVLPVHQPQKNVLKDITNSIQPMERSKTQRLKSTTLKHTTDLRSPEPITKSNDPKTKDNQVTHKTNLVEKSEVNQVPKTISIDPPVQPAKHIPERLTSTIDMSKSSFTVPRNARISDISDASSTDCSNLSRELHNESEEGTIGIDPHNNDLIDSSMLSNNGDLCNDELIESEDEFENPVVCEPPKDVADSSMLSANGDSDGDGNKKDPNKKASLASDSEDESEDEIETSHHLAVNEIIDSSMLSNIEDEVDELTDGLNNTSLGTNSADVCEVDELTDVLNSTSLGTNTADVHQSISESSASNIPKTTVIDRPTNVDTIPKSKRSNIIEISDSSEDEAEICSSHVRPRVVPPPKVNSAVIRPTDTHQASHSFRENIPTQQQQQQQQQQFRENITLPPAITPAMCWSKMQNMKLQMRRQQELYSRFGRTMPDGGKKLLENISDLAKEFEQAKREFSESQKAKSGTLPINVHFPSMNNGPAQYTSMNNGAVQYTDPHGHVPEMGYAGQYRPAPLFGGRMTEKRLKEVGSITKNTIEQLHKSLESRPAPSEEAEDPKNLKVSLMTHQKQALAWLLWREKQIPPGGILADDMGLGKTLTMISLALKSKQDDLSQMKELPKDSKLILSRGSVIICPASLIHQWQKEVEKRVKDDRFSVYLYHGGNREKRVKKLAKYDIVLTTYNIASIEGKRYSIDDKAKPQEQLSDWQDASQPKLPEEGPLFKIFWRRIILDEGHTIKNHKTASSIAICAMEGESRWIVTGTPIQNNTMELYSLIKFIRVTPFDEFKVWRREVDNRMTSGTKRMNSIVASLLLRRTKDQVDSKTGKPLIVLPKRTATLHKLKLLKGELEVYELVQNYSKKIFKKFLDNRKDAADGEPIDPSQHQEKETYEMPVSILGIKAEEALSMLGLHGSNVVTQGCLLVLVLRLRQCCTHLSLMCEQIDPELCRSEGIDVPLDEQLGNLSIDEDKLSGSRPREMLPTFLSSKITTLLSCLSDQKKESTGKPIKSVIVSQWTRMLEIVAYHLKVAGYRYDFITGSVAVKKRSDIVDSFNNERYPEIMLVSLKAGGVGLNLIGGSHLFLLDQHWNPALEDQASDRIYRVGQKNDVTVHRFLCTDTVEERIAALQEKKKALANSVLYGGKMAQKLTLADLKMIFGLGI